MVKKENVFVGQIYECLNLDRYRKDGEKSIIPWMQIGSMIESDIVDNVRKVCDFALLIKKGESYLHIALDGQKILLNTYPDKENRFYVMEKTLTPYYEDEEQLKKVSQRKLVKSYISDARIPIGKNN